MSEATQKAEAARQIKANPVYREAWEQIREDIVRSIESNSLTDDHYRDKLMLSLQLLHRLDRMFQQYIDNGRIDENNSKRTVMNRRGL